MCKLAWHTFDAHCVDLHGQTMIRFNMAWLYCRATTMKMVCKGEMSSTGVLNTLQIRCGGSDELVHFCTVFSEHGFMRTGVCL